MLSIDEAIAHAREVAEIQRKDNDNCNVNGKLFSIDLGK